MPRLVDIGDTPPAQCEHCRDLLAKAMAKDPGGEKATIWDGHENVWIADHVEDVTRRMQAPLRQILATFSALLTGKPVSELAKSDQGQWMRMEAAEIEQARAYLASKNPVYFTLDDWLLAADLIVQTYAPATAINSQAEYLTVRAALLGKISAGMARGKPSRPSIASVTELVPTTFAQVPPKVLTEVEAATLRLATARAAQNISDLTDQTRSTIKKIIVEHVQAQLLGQNEGGSRYLDQRLHDVFGDLNLDTRRIAITEAGEVCNSGFIGAQSPGTRVKRMEAYRGACPFCKSINGRILTVVRPDKQDKDGQTEVWVGKTNVGRSPANRKQQGADLVERADKELWWIAAGVQHPHCRGAWVIVPGDPPPGVSKQFHSFLHGLLAEADRKHEARQRPA